MLDLALWGGSSNPQKEKKTSLEDDSNTINIGTSTQIETYCPDVTFGNRSNHPSGYQHTRQGSFFCYRKYRTKKCQHVRHPSQNIVTITTRMPIQQMKDDQTSSLGVFRIGERNNQKTTTKVKHSRTMIDKYFRS